MSTGDVAKAASEFISSQKAALTETNPNKRGEADASTGRSTVKAEERVVVSSQNTNRVRRWGSRDSVRAPVGLKYGRHGSMLDKYNQNTLTVTSDIVKTITTRSIK